ncbi:MAG: YiiX/YebB-like N1pC/P60 family cysteine hydrolase [Alphaproteobacteria bacterium]|nr:YiiX/YebB-like N1pC/P60 family cysteine hydrolase [Alphaproteobacteria bacterium]
MTIRKKFLWGALVFLAGMATCAIGVGYGWVHMTRPAPDLSDRLKSGDIVFQTDTSEQSWPVMLATRSLYSHVGLVRVAKDKNGKRKATVLEAVNPVREIDFSDWVQRGLAERILVKRIGNLDITGRTGRKIVDTALAFSTQQIDKPYDIYFRSADDTFYCSELVYDAYSAAGIEVGQIEKVSDMALDAAPVQALIHQRMKRHPDCLEKGATDVDACMAIIKAQELVTPASIAADKKLETVYSNYGVD